MTSNQLHCLPRSEARIETPAASNSAAFFLEALQILQGAPLLLYPRTELLLKKTKLLFGYGPLSAGVDALSAARLFRREGWEAGSKEAPRLLDARRAYLQGSFKER